MKQTGIVIAETKELKLIVPSLKKRDEQMKKGNFLLITLCLLVLGFSVIPAQAGPFTFSWSGNPIVGEDPGFLPSGSAVFEINGGMLTITLTNTTSQQSTSIGEVLTILTWDIEGASLTTGTAVIGAMSSLVGVDSGDFPGIVNLSSEWAFKDNISAGSSFFGPIGSFGIGAVGDINFGVDSFGPKDRFDTSTNLFPPPSGSLNGVDGGIVGPDQLAFDADGYAHHGPLVKYQMVFTFDITGDLSTYNITNVQALYGTDGAPLVPEPATLLLVGSGLLGGAFFRKRFKG